MKTSPWRVLFAVGALAVAACGGDDSAIVSEPDSVAPEVTTSDVTSTTTTTVPDEPATTVPPLPSTTPPPAATTTSTPPHAVGDDLAALIARQEVTVTATSPDGGVSGEILDVSLTNETDRELTVLVPCGLIFTPVGGEPDEPEPEPEPEDGASPIGVVEVQRMMVVQPVVVPGASLVFLPPSGTTFLTPYVMCIDSERPAPESGAVYGVGEMATDELLALATCVCERDLGAELDPAMGDMSLQLAIWAASEGALPDMTDDLSELDGALADLVGDGIGLDLEELEELTGLEGFDLDTMLAQALQFMDDYQASASTWLEECGIELEE